METPITPKQFYQMPTEIINWAVDWSTRGLDVGETVLTATFAPLTGDASFSITNVDADGVFSFMTLTGGLADQTLIPTILATANTSSGQKLQEIIPYKCVSVRYI